MSSRAGALKVAAGILSSRLFGFVRDAAVAFFFGAGAHADVFRTALRGPNVLQNLLGEQTLSASFIPVYCRFLEEGRREDGARFAGAVFGWLVAVAAGLALVGVLAARPLVGLLAPGYLGDAAAIAAGEAVVDRFELTVAAVRWIFPMTAVLVVSAWCLGVLNSHRRLFLPYFAPVLWNVGILAGLFAVAAGLVPAAWLPGPAGTREERLLTGLCAGALLGAVMQVGVQLPFVFQHLGRFRPSLSRRVEGLGAAVRAFTPLVAGRGVVQISGYLDLLLASLLAAGAVGALGYAQPLYLLPISLFGMSVAAAELPELSRRAAPEARVEVAARLDEALRQTAFLTLPTFVGYLAFGGLLVGLIYQRGSFGSPDARLVTAIVAAYALGLPASNASRLLNNVFFSLLETRVPAWIAVRRVAVALVLGLPLMLVFDRFPVAGRDDLRYGAVGLALAASVAAWVEVTLLWRSGRERLPELTLPLVAAGRMTALSLVAALPAGLVAWALRGSPFLLTTPVVVGSFAGLYLLGSWALGAPELRLWLLRAGLGRRGDDSGRNP